MACVAARLAVAVVGGGPSGLAACKAALEEGLRPVVFEQASGLGGLWRSDRHGKVWKSLRTNLSKYTCAFSDAPWPESAPDFPNSAEVRAYLEAYAAQNSLLQHIRFNSRVISLEPDAQGAAWSVTWEEEEEEEEGSDGAPPRKKHSEQFRFVLVATGIFSKPDLGIAAGFAGELLHAAEYRDPDNFAGKRVLVVGAAFSGADVAAEVAEKAASVTVATRRRMWYLPRYIGGRPADLAFYSRASNDKSQNSTEAERNAKRHKFFSSIVGDVPASLEAPDPDRGDLPFVAISDSFLAAVRGGRLRARSAEAVGFDGLSVSFADGLQEEFDVVIVATGYHLELPFFSPEALAIMEFDASDLLQPVILHECVWRPELQGMAFVGLYRGPYFASMELQARWACGVFSGRLPPPPEDEVTRGLESERSVRTAQPRPQFPHGDYVAMAETLARHVGVHPSEALASQTHPLHHLLYNGPLLPFHYRLEGFQAKPAVAEAAILECAQKHPF